LPTGYAGKLLFVDLTTEKIQEETLGEDLANDFIGGYGIGAKILYDRMPAGADPLGPDSYIGFMTGLTNDTKSLFGGRYTLVHKSPITGGWNDANSGGHFGPELKKAGYDGLFVYGKAKKPVYIYIKDGNVEICSAENLWGKTTKETLERLKEETGEEKIRASIIGKTGENQSYLACPINDRHRAPGRGGGGAVMGSKNLKAVAVRGTHKTDVADPDKIRDANMEISKNKKENKGIQRLGDRGTGGGTPSASLSGDAPVKNWKGVGIIDFGETSAENVGSKNLDRYKTEKYHCNSCPLGCGAEYSVPDGRWPVESTQRPEYETAGAFGPTLLCDEEDVIIHCNELCNIHGMDTISAGMTIAWAMECYEEGLLSRDDLDGIDLSWGNGEAIVQMLEKMVKGEGVGKTLANGSAYAAKHFGKGEEYLQTASGIELPMHDPRYAPGLARTYQFDPTPGRHVKGGLGSLHMGNKQKGDKYDYEDTGEIDVKLMVHREILNTAGFCLFGSGVTPRRLHHQFIEGITGREFNDEIAYKTGLRIYIQRHVFNLREGIAPKDMTLTLRAVGQPPQEAGPLEGKTVDHKKLGENFFTTLGWDLDSGKPPKKQMENLGGLENVIEDLYGPS